LRSSLTQPMGISIPQIRTQLNGRLVTPDDPVYDQARTLFYGGFDRRPQLIVQAANAADVARVVALARETGLELAVRSGGHSLAGTASSTGGLCWTCRPCAGSTSMLRRALHGRSRA
jgi:FAD binding domain